MNQRVFNTSYASGWDWRHTTSFGFYLNLHGEALQRHTAGEASCVGHSVKLKQRTTLAVILCGGKNIALTWRCVLLLV